MNLAGSPLYASQRRRGREAAMQFLYQCEREKIFYFNAVELANFIEHHDLSTALVPFVQRILEQTFARLSEIDKQIEATSSNWRIGRMCSIDRCVLRLAVGEFYVGLTPEKVIINEAVDIAKRFGTEQSGRFVNGVLDKLVANMVKESKPYEDSEILSGDMLDPSRDLLDTLQEPNLPA